MKLLELLKNRRVRQFILFGIIGTLGTIVNTVALYLLKSHVGLYIPIASAIATEISIIFNFYGNHRLTFKGHQNVAPLWQKFLKFQGVSMAALIITVGMLWGLTTLLGESLYLLWNLVAIAAAFLVNFVLNVKFTWADPKTHI